MCIEYIVIAHMDNDMPEKLRHDRNYMASLIVRDVEMFEYAADELKDDKEFVLYLIVIRGIPEVAWYISDRLKKDRDIAIAVIDREPLCLSYGAPSLLDDLEIIKYAVSKDATTLRFASDKIRNNYNIAMQAVRKHGSSVMFVGKSLRDNEKINIAAVNETPVALKIVRIVLPQEIYLDAIGRLPMAINWVPKIILKNPEFIKNVVLLPKIGCLKKSKWSILRKIRILVKMQLRINIDYIVILLINYT